MRSLSALTFAGEKFSTSATYDGANITVRLVGDGNMKAVGAVEDILHQLDAEARRLHPKVVTLDFERLEFLNSACFKKVVTWLSRVQELEMERRFRVHFVSNPKMMWQRRSLDALRCFAVDLITVDP